MNDTEPNAGHPAHALPLYLAWWRGFDYMFGYPLKLLRDLWGIDESH